MCKLGEASWLACFFCGHVLEVLLLKSFLYVQLTDALSGALKQALRSQLSTPAGSRRASEDTPSAASAAAQQQAFPPLPAPTSNRNSSEQQQSQLGCYAQLALTSQLFGPSPFQGAPPLPPIQVPARRLSAERKNSGSLLRTVDESPPSQHSAESPVALAPHDAAAAARSSLFRALNEHRGTLLARHSMGAAPNSCGGRPPISPRRKSISEESASFPAAPFEALGLPTTGEAGSSPLRLSCARARNKAQQGVAQARRVAAAATAAVQAKPAQEAARQLPGSQASTALVPAADGLAPTVGSQKRAQAPQDTPGVLAAVVEQLAEETERAKRLAEVAPRDLALHPPSLRPVRIALPEPQQPAAPKDARVAANMRELSLEHFVHSNSRLFGSGKSSADAVAKQDTDATAAEERKQPPCSCSAAVVAAPNGAAPSGPPGPAAAAAKGEAARALFSINKSADAASRAVVRSFGRSNSLQGEELCAVQPSASAPLAAALSLGPVASSPNRTGLTDNFKDLTINLRRSGETEAQRR